LADALVVWKVLCDAGPVPTWESWAANDPWPSRYTAEELEQWRQSGLPMPTGKAALVLARRWVHDPPLAGPDETGKPCDARKAIQAVRWFKRHGQLPSNAAQDLLRTFLETVRPDASDRQAMLEW